MGSGLSQEELAKLIDLRHALKPRRDAELDAEEAQGIRPRGLDRLMAMPDRWIAAHTMRCINDHVSTMVLKSEALGRNACLAARCLAPLVLTFPEDKDGPLCPPDK